MRFISKLMNLKSTGGFKIFNTVRPVTARRGDCWWGKWATKIPNIKNKYLNPSCHALGSL